MPMLAMVAARNNQRVIDFQLLEDQAKFTHKSFQGELKGLKGRQRRRGKAMTVGYGLWALRLADWKPDDTTEAMVTYLLKTQTRRRLLDGAGKPATVRRNRISLRRCWRFRA